MLSIPSKMMESCAADDIKEHILQNGLVNDKQWAYKKGRSSELLLIHLTEIWRYAVESKRVVGVVFVDFMKAFDTVSHTILLQKLDNAGIRGNFLLWLKDYLSQRKQFVSIDGESSEMALVPYGVPQGSVLGPVLFSMFISRCCNFQVKQSPGRVKGMVQQQPPHSTPW